MYEDYFDEEFSQDYDDTEMEDYPEDFDSDDEENRMEFADPGGNSALRAETNTNPRNLSCPTCKEPNRLTPKDVALFYQCDRCADRDERGY